MSGVTILYGLLGLLVGIISVWLNMVFNFFDLNMVGNASFEDLSTNIADYFSDIKEYIKIPNFEVSKRTGQASNGKEMNETEIRKIMYEIKAEYTNLENDIISFRDTNNYIMQEKLYILQGEELKREDKIFPEALSNLKTSELQTNFTEDDIEEIMKIIMKYY